MAEEPDLNIPIPATLQEKLIFYLTAFFLLLGIFSAFGFLFLVPFVIEPAYTTIKMDFDEEPAECITASTENRRGLSNCTWTSCREGCTREIYECTQILVNYKHPNIPNSIVLDNTNVEENENDENSYHTDNEKIEGSMKKSSDKVDSGYTNGKDVNNDYKIDHEQRALVEYDEDNEDFIFDGSHNYYATISHEELKKFKWFYGARLFPNVKGCGYPPYLNCTIFNNTYVRVGANFSCYYSRADPSLVVSELDMKRVHLNLFCALVIPIVSFVLSVVYLTIAYLYIYNNPKKKEKNVSCRRNTAAAAAAAALAAASTATSNTAKSKKLVQVTPLALSTPVAPPTSGVLTPVSDLFQDDVDSFGHEYKYAMVDDMLSRDSLDSLAFNYSSSMNG